MKNRMIQKMRDRSGASMLLALVFLMFCVFIGGTVLAAASANGYRAADRTKKQQYLDERSAALLLTEQLKTDEDHSFQLIVEDIKVNKQKGSVGEGGEWLGEAGNTSAERVITFRAMQNAEMSSMQRLVMETAVWNYLKKDPVYQKDNVVLAGFLYGGAELTKLDDFWTQPDVSAAGVLSGTISVDGKNGDVVFADCDMRYICGEDYSITMDFGEDSQLVIEMHALSDATEPADQSAIKAEADGTYQIKSTQSRTVIVWSDPVIVKGGAAE